MAPSIIDTFSNRYRWLSNFWPAPVRLTDVSYPTVEHAYQAAKTTDITLRAQIAVCPRPGGAKRLGRHLPLRPHWGGMRLAVMLDLLRQKFAPGTDLADKLVATKTATLIEGNTWGDRFWGVDAVEQLGENHLGLLLMRVRGELMREQGETPTHGP